MTTLGLLADKVGLVTGVANEPSIAARSGSIDPGGVLQARSSPIELQRPSMTKGAVMNEVDVAIILPPPQLRAAQKAADVASRLHV